MEGNFNKMIQPDSKAEATMSASAVGQNKFSVSCKVYTVVALFFFAEW